jgi:hypothetical protein
VDVAAFREGLIGPGHAGFPRRLGSLGGDQGVAARSDPIRSPRPASRSAFRTSKSFSGLKNWSSARCILRSLGFVAVKTSSPVNGLIPV